MYQGRLIYLSNRLSLPHRPPRLRPVFLDSHTRSFRVSAIRVSLSFSKKMENPIGATGYCVHPSKAFLAIEHDLSGLPGHGDLPYQPCDHIFDLEAIELGFGAQEQAMAE